MKQQKTVHFEKLPFSNCTFVEKWKNNNKKYNLSITFGHEILLHKTKCHLFP